MLQGSTTLSGNLETLDDVRTEKRLSENLIYDGILVGNWSYTHGLALTRPFPVTNRRRARTGMLGA